MKIKKEEKKSNVTYLNNLNKKTINKKKLIIVIIITTIIITFLSLFITYVFNEQFRKFCDSHVFFKNIEENNLPKIYLDKDANIKTLAYLNYIGIIQDNKVSKYDSSGNLVSETDVEISKPAIATSNEYVVIAEEEGQRIYLISNRGILWQKDLEGNISRISVNSKGYVSVILSGTSYKSVIILYDESGKELFKTYLSSTIAVDTTVSQDNKYLSFAEINISGTLIQSNIKVISISKALESPSDSIIYTYKAESNDLIVEIKYQNKNKLVCKYDNSIHVIDENKDKKIVSLNEYNKKILYSDIELYDNAVRTIEENEGVLDVNSIIELTNTSNERKNIYNLKGSLRNLYCYGDRVGVNIGSEVHFIDMNGWLVKKYTASKEVSDVIMSDHIAGIVYKDKIEIIDL